MAWPVDTFFAEAPGYSFSGSLPWNSGGSAVFSNFMQACSTYESTARNAMKSLVNNGWLTTGQTHTGTAAPSLPEDHLVPFVGNCGSGQRSTRALIGNCGFTQVEVQFYGKKYKKEYRWVEDVAYIAPGKWYWTYNPWYYETNCPDYPNISSVRDELYAVLAGQQFDTQQQANDYYASATASFVGRYVCISGVGSLPDPRIICSVGNGTQPGLYIYIAGGCYGGGWITQAQSAGVMGEWHLEMRIVADDSDGSACGVARYAQMSRAEEDKRRPEPPNKPRGFPPNPWAFPPPNPGGGGGGPWPPNTGPNGGDNTIHLTNTCQGTWIRSADIWDLNLEELLTSGDIVLSPGYTLEGEYHPAVTWSFTTPGGFVTIQEGTPLLGYNELQGAVVYDTDLKKWGKWRQPYTCLIEFSGINAFNSANFNYTDLGMTAGLLHSDGLIYLFDHQPADSWIRYGKIGYYRLGMVHFLEARIDFRNYATGTIEVDFSMDGRNLDSTISQSYTYNSVLSYRVYPNQRSRWSTLKISGNYDLQYMEVRGNISCRR